MGGEVRAPDNPPPAPDAVTPSPPAEAQLAKRCARCGGSLPRDCKYCSRDCANEARRDWHAAHPGANRPKHQSGTLAPRPSTKPLRTAQLKSAQVKSAQVQSARRDRERDLSRQREEAEERRQQVVRPRIKLGYDSSVVIRPPRPAPVKRYRDTGRPCEFQDDLNALADHGSRGPLPLIAVGQSRRSSIADA